MQIKTKSEYIKDLLKYYVENKDGNGEVFKDFNKMYSSNVIIKQYIKEEFDFKQSAKDVLITSQLRTAMILNKNIKSSNYQIDTYKKKIYIYGIAITSEEKDKVIQEAKEILDVDGVIASIILVDDLRIQKE